MFFRNVPFCIPDEEIINPCRCYGEPVNNRVTYYRPSKESRGVAESSMCVDMRMLPGKPTFRRQHLAKCQKYRNPSLKTENPPTFLHPSMPQGTTTRLSFPPSGSETWSMSSPTGPRPGTPTVSCSYTTTSGLPLTRNSPCRASGTIQSRSSTKTSTSIPV